MLRINNPIRNSAQFERIQSRLQRMPRAQTMAEIAQSSNRNGQVGQNPTSGGRYSARVAYPSRRYKTYNGGGIQLSIPDNWRDFGSQGSVQFAPEGAYGNEGITHGAMIGVAQTNSRNLAQASEEYVNGVLQSNNYLRQNSDFTRTTVSGRQAYATVLAGRSPITNRTEIATVYTTLLRNGGLLYIVMVTPENESSSYNAAFRNMINSIRLND
jgi:hypothetical protein